MIGMGLVGAGHGKRSLGDGPVALLVVSEKHSITNSKESSLSAEMANLTSEQHEIAKLVATAREQGKPDAFSGKRRWPRYQWGMRLDVATLEDGVSRQLDVAMHNISGGGLGFWSKQQLHESEAIYIRRWTENSDGEWLPAQVTHCTAGIQGYLIGAMFDHPCSDDDVVLDVEGYKTPSDETREETPAIEEETLEEKDELAVGQTLSNRFAGTAAGAALLGAIVVSCLWFQFQGSIYQLHITAGGAALIVGLCGLLARFTARQDVRFLLSIRSAVRHMGQGASRPLNLREAGSMELNALRNGLLDLSVRWRRREDDERAQRHKLEELSQLKSNILSIVSHDLRTPLTSILLYADMLTEELGTLQEEDQRNFLNIITGECNRLSRLVDDLLEVQRLESDRTHWDMKSQDLSGTIRACARVFDAMAQSKSIKFIVDCPEVLPPTEADADKISQVISNLLSNAMKFTPTGGTVRLTAEARSQEILLKVADTGPGIPREKWDQLFDRFSQLGDPNVTEIEGFGLGLYIVKRIVESHGGAAWLDSEMGHGTEFCISLPTQHSIEGCTRDHTAPPSAGCVLICDPDPELCAMLAQTLRWADFEVKTCHSGVRLMAKLAAGDIDLVVTDLLLPDMNAQELLDGLNHFPDRSFRVVIHTYTVDEVVPNLDGVDAFLRRPVSKEELVETVRNHLSTRPVDRLNILLVTADEFNSTSLIKQLISAGHTLSTVSSLDEVTQSFGDQHINRLLIPIEVLSPRWPEIGVVTSVVDHPDNVIILALLPTKRDRRLAEQYGVRLVNVEPAQEVNVIPAILEDPKSTAMEYSS